MTNPLTWGINQEAIQCRREATRSELFWGSGYRGCSSVQNGLTATATAQETAIPWETAEPRVAKLVDLAGAGRMRRMS